MSLVDDLIENLVERNAIDLDGTFTITAINGGIGIKGSVRSTIRDQKKNRQILKVEAPLDANVGVGTIVIPMLQIK